MLLCLSGSQQRCSIWPSLILRLVNIHRRENSLSLRGGEAPRGEGGEPGRQMGRTWLEGGTMRPEGSLDVIWPDDRILIQNRRKIFITARLSTFIRNNTL